MKSFSFSRQWRGISIIAAALGLFCLRPAHALTPANDFDGDGYSDPVFISIAGDHSLNWSVLSGQTGQQISSLQSVGALGDNITPARWFTKSHASLGYLTLSGPSLVWYAQDTNGQWQHATFGKNGDTAISGGDFDGDGISDAAVVRSQSNGRLLWIIQRRLFAPAAASAIRFRSLPARKQIVFGNVGDTPFFMSPTGKLDYIAVVKADGSSVQMRAVYTTATRSFKLGQKGAGILPPLPIRRGALSDQVLLAKRGGSSTTFTTLSARGAALSQSEISSTGEIILGKFSPAVAEQVAVQKGAQFTLLNARTGATSPVTWSNAIPVDDININNYGKAPNPTPTPPPNSTSPPNLGSRTDNPPPAVGTLHSICTALHPMNTEVLYKNGSGGTSDSRTGHPTFLWYDGFTDDPEVNKLYVLSSSGAQIGIMGLYSPSIRPLVRFYSGYSPGTFDTGQALKSKAIATSGTGSIYVYTKNGNCWGPILDPNGRSGGKP